MTTWSTANTSVPSELLNGVHYNLKARLLNVTSENVNDIRVLHLACYYGELDVVHWLVKSLGADPNQEWGRMNPMHEAALFGHDEVIRELLRCKAKIDGTVNDSAWRTPLHYALNFRKKSTIRLLIDNGANFMLGTRFIEAQIPKEVYDQVLFREKCRKVCHTILGLRRFRYGLLLNLNCKNIIQLIVHYIWKTRFEEKWELAFDKK